MYSESTAQQPPARAWRFGQCFGEKGESDIKLTEADVLSAVRFDDSGDYLATGDRGGRIVVFERAGGGKHRRRAAALSVASDGTNSSASDSIGHAGDPQSRPPPALTGPGSSEYRFYTEFQSHEAEFDYLKSLEIEEKINQIAWCRRSGPSLMLLSTNEKTIKLWKIQEKKLRSVANFNVTTGPYGGHSPVNALRVPTLSAAGETAVTTTPRRVYATAHAYHINSIAVNSDGQTFLSSDDLRVHLWHLDNPTLSFNVVDIKPSTLEELTEVITAAEFHPTSCNLFVYSSSRGTIRLADMRDSALCDRPAKIFQEAEDANARSYFNEVTAGVSDIEFTRDGRYIVSRDYLTLKIWDPAMEARPLRVIPVHEHLRPRLMDLYESDCIFDKFEVSCSASSLAAAAAGGSGSLLSGGTGSSAGFGGSASALGGSAAGSGGSSSATGGAVGGGSAPGAGGGDLAGVSIITGSYNNTLRVYDLGADSETTIELSKTRPKPPTSRPIPALGAPGAGGGGGDVAMDGSWGSDGGGGFFGYGGGLGGGADRVDFTKKLLHCSFHPSEPIIAVAGAANLFIYAGM